MNSQCNAGTTKTNKRGSCGDFKVWLNKKVITKLSSIPMLEASIYTVPTHTKEEWKVITPDGDTIPFRRDPGLCARMLYIDVREYKEGLVMIKTVCKNTTGLIPHKIEKAKMSRQTQG